jgi:integrase
MDSLFNKGLDTKDSQNRAVPHSLRHTFASLLVINGTPIYEVMKLMSHSSIDITMRYAKLAPDSGQNAVNNII